MSTDVPSSLAIHQLPDDPALLKRMIAEREQAHRVELARAVAEQQAAIDSAVAAQIDSAVAAAVKQAVKEAVEATTAALLKRFYGPKNETFDPRQLLLFGERIDQLPLDVPSIEAEAGEELVTRRVKKKHKHGRNPLPDHLPRIDIEHDLKDEEKPCPHCGELRCRIGQEISEQLEYLPASFKVLRHIRHKYACRQCDAVGHSPNITTAAKPEQPIDKGLAGPGLIAYVAVSKFQDHSPLYRLEQIFARQQVDIARSTMCAWMAAGAKLLQPLVALLMQRVKASRVIHTDDTRVPIQAPGEKKCRSGRLWTYIGDADHPYIVFDYTPDRSRAGPQTWLADYRGYLQADAYGAYDGIYAPGHVHEVACWAHARRKFFEAQETDRRRAGQMLLMIRELYAIEDRARELADAQRLALRQTQSIPVLAKIDAWLDEQSASADVLPRGPLGQAITYARNQWAALCRYTERGFLNIDNNAAERALKRVAIGRKNWLFAGSATGAHTAATLFSVTSSCHRHGVDVFAYLHDILQRLAHLSNPSSEQLRAWLPDRWRPPSVPPLNEPAEHSAPSPP
jgi:transposase